MGATLLEVLEAPLHHGPREPEASHSALGLCGNQPLGPGKKQGFRALGRGPNPKHTKPHIDTDI